MLIIVLPAFKMAVTLFHDQTQVLHVFFHVNKERNGVRKKERKEGRKTENCTGWKVGGKRGR